MPFSLNYSTPIVRRTKNGGEEIVAIGSGRVIGYDAETGDERWSREMPNGSIISGHAFTEDLVFTQTYSAEVVPSFDDLLKKSDKDGNGVLSGAEFGEGKLGRVLTAFGSMAGTRDGIVDREEWAEVWRWVGAPALTAVRLDGDTERPGTEWRSIAALPAYLRLWC